MAETRSSRRETARRPSRSRQNAPSDLGEDVRDMRAAEEERYEDMPADEEAGNGRNVAEAPPAPATPPNDDEAVFDDETNQRYEEVKRGGMHITQLQQMTMQ